jgi:DNA polymerase-3 subunit gamma/tau
MENKESRDNIALYRKYRPIKWDDVLGQGHIVDVLKGAIKQGNISHAYLFSGTRGTGKTSIARIFAEDIGVSKNDVYEIDAASNRGIDDIRDLRDAVQVLPLESPYKVYIIDEVHMLTKEAFNALLKTLEEPPKHVVFVLATTEMQKLPDTVVSRCQTFSFKKPNHSVLKNLILGVAKKEGFTLETSSSDLIATLGDGSFRDAMGVLQKVIGSSSDKKINTKDVEMIVGAPPSRLVNGTIESVSKKDVGLGIDMINKAVEQNVDIKIFVKLILQKLRAILLLRFAPDMKNLLEGNFSEEDFKFIYELASNKDSNISSNVIKEFLDAYQEIGYSYIPHLPLELAIIKLVGDNTKN